MNEAKKDQYFSKARVPKKSVKTRWHKVCFWSERTQQKKEPHTFNYPACDEDERVPKPDRRRRVNRVRTYNPNRRLHEPNLNPNPYGRQGRIATAANRTLPNTPVSSRRSSARNSPADNGNNFGDISTVSSSKSSRRSSPDYFNPFHGTPSPKSAKSSRRSTPSSNGGPYPAYTSPGATPAYRRFYAGLQPKETTPDYYNPFNSNPSTGSSYGYSPMDLISPGRKLYKDTNHAIFWLHQEIAEMVEEFQQERDELLKHPLKAKYEVLQELLSKFSEGKYNKRTRVHSYNEQLTDEGYENEAAELFDRIHKQFPDFKTPMLSKKAVEVIDMLSPEEKEELQKSLTPIEKALVTHSLQASPVVEYAHAHPHHSPVVEHHNALRPVNKQLFPAKKKKSPLKRSPIKTRSKSAKHFQVTNWSEETQQKLV